jgi:hypothetical protein
MVPPACTLVCLPPAAARGDDGVDVLPLCHELAVEEDASLSSHRSSSAHCLDCRSGGHAAPNGVELNCVTWRVRCDRRDVHSHTVHIDHPLVKQSARTSVRIQVRVHQPPVHICELHGSSSDCADAHFISGFVLLSPLMRAYARNDEPVHIWF